MRRFASCAERPDYKGQCADSATSASRTTAARTFTNFTFDVQASGEPQAARAVIAGLEANGTPVSDWMELAELTKSERDYVIKPSGLSELAWGSRGVRVANDLTKDEWVATLREAIGEFDRTPRILQRFYKGKRVRQSYLDRTEDDIRTFDGRVRLCPYFFVVEGQARLGDILATVAPADKRLIHGMTDAVMAPSIVRADGN